MRSDVSVCAALLGSLTFVGSAPADIVQFLDEATWQSVITNRTELDFDGFTGPLSTQFPGLTFSSFNGGNPRATEKPFALSTPNVMDVNISGQGGGGGWALDFATPVDGLGFWTNDTEFPGSAITFRDASGAFLGVAELLNPHAAEWVFQGFVSSETNVSRVEITVNSADYIVHDNLQIGLVPEPSTIWLSALAAASILRRRR